MSFLDRFSGQSLEVPPERAHFGRWLCRPGNRPEHINGCLACDGDVLAPGATGDWVFEGPSGVIPIRGRFVADAVPDDQDAEALLQLGQMLREPDGAKGGWRKWKEISPFAPGLDEEIKPDPLEDRIEAEFKHLAAVCQNPRTHIRRETERVFVARARLIARDAPEWLASHTEDWSHRTIAGIRPRRILADIREERWDLYENRVAVQLIDDLLAWLRRRIAVVRRIRVDVYARMDKIRGSASGTHRRASRIYALWGEAWDDNSSKVAESTLKRLEELLYKLLGLMDSPLYRHIPVRAGVPGGLRITNLFGNDDHYRGVARLWRDWSRRAVPRHPSPSELSARYQDLHRGFDAWCMLLIVRACSQLRLGFVEGADPAPELKPGNAVRLDRAFLIEWESTGAITFTDTNENRTLVRFVPMVHGFEGARTREAVEARVAPLVEAVAGADHWTVVLHLAIPGEPRYDALAGIGHPPFPGTLGTIDFIRVSPFSLDSVERVSRAIRWSTLAPRMLAYPPTVQRLPESTLRAIPELQAILASDPANGPRLDRKRTEGWAVLQPPPVRLLNTVAQCVEDARSRRHGLTQQRERLQGDHGNKTRRSKLNKEIEHVTKLVDRLDTFHWESGKACSTLLALTTCPACGHDGAEFEVRDHDCFFAHCKACEAQWELRYDPKVASRVAGTDRTTKSRIPVFCPAGDPDRHQWPDDAAPQWVDDLLGCDVLAVPAGPNGGFFPPRTTSRSL